MEVVGTVSSVVNGRFRVNIGGTISSPIPKLTSACTIALVDGQLVLSGPVPGSKVLCWFPGNALCSGYIIGMPEGDAP